VNGCIDLSIGEFCPLGCEGLVSMKEMGVRRCLEILDLGMESSVEDVKQAYRDCVNVWHPDRFANNPRLKEKAEKKLKEINQAHETLTSFLSQQAKARVSRTSNAGEKNEQHAESEAFGTPSSMMVSRTEAFAETGTRIFLTASSRIIMMFRRWIDADGP
jgi:DnaJ-class molecular chaperone